MSEESRPKHQDLFGLSPEMFELELCPAFMAAIGWTTLLNCDPSFLWSIHDSHCACSLRLESTPDPFRSEGSSA